MNKVLDVNINLMYLDRKFQYGYKILYIFGLKNPNDQVAHIINWKLIEGFYLINKENLHQSFPIDNEIKTIKDLLNYYAIIIKSVFGLYLQTKEFKNFMTCYIIGGDDKVLAIRNNRVKYVPKGFPIDEFSIDSNLE